MSIINESSVMNNNSIMWIGDCSLPISLKLDSFLNNLYLLPFRMISDVQLAVFVNILGVSLFLMVVLYHYIAANNPKTH